MEIPDKSVRGLELGTLSTGDLEDDEDDEADDDDNNDDDDDNNSQSFPPLHSSYRSFEEMEVC